MNGVRVVSTHDDAIEQQLFSLYVPWIRDDDDLVVVAAAVVVVVAVVRKTYRPEPNIASN